MESSPVRNRLLLVIAALLFSTGGAAFKAVTLTAWQVASFRSGIAAVVLLAAFPKRAAAGHGGSCPSPSAYAATLILFVLANRLTTAANAIFLQSSAPLYLLLLGPLLLHEPIHRADVVYMLAVLVGITLFFVGTPVGHGDRARPAPRRHRRSGKRRHLCIHARRLALARSRRRGHGGTRRRRRSATCSACVFALPMALPLHGAGASDIAVLLYLGIVQMGLAYVCLTRAIRHVRAVEATTLLMIEPALSPVWSWLVHGERPGALPLAGGAVILAASVINTWRRVSPGAAHVASPPPL